MFMFLPGVMVLEKTKVGLARAVLVVQMVMRMVVVKVLGLAQLYCLNGDNMTTRSR